MMRVLLLMLVLAFAAGCSLNPLYVEEKNIENSKRLRVGMTKAEVLKIMGEPLKDEEFNRPDVWFYYVSCNWYDGLTTEDECMPLVFQNGRLAGWGNDFYARYRLQKQQAPAKVEIPPEARDAATERAPYRY